MENLSLIAEIVSKYSSFISKFNLAGGKQTKQKELLLKLATGKALSDTKTEKELYGTIGNTLPYRNLKKRTRKLLLSQLFSLDIQKSPLHEYGKQEYKCFIGLIQIRILQQFGSPRAAAPLAEKVLHRCQKWRFNDIALNLAKTLRSHYANRGVQHRFNHYSTLTRQYLNLYEEELLAEELYQQLAVRYARSAARDEEIRTLAKENYHKVQKLNSKGSFVIEYYQYNIAVNYFWLNYKWKQAIEVCSEAEQKADHNPLIKMRLPFFALNKMDCYRMLKDFPKAYMHAQTALSLFKKGSLNWFIFLEYYFLLAMHTQNYSEASGILEKIKKENYLKRAGAERTGKWKIFESYLLLMLIFLDEKGIISSASFPAKMAIYSADKRGYNIAIRILQIMLLLKEQRYSEIADKKEALQSYRSRHLRKNNHYRSNVFIRMLLIMIKEDFNYKRIERLGRRYNKMLLAFPAEKERNEYEVVPYEVLWKKVLKLLKEKQRAAQLQQKKELKKQVLEKQSI